MDFYGIMAGVTNIGDLPSDCIVTKNSVKIPLSQAETRRQWILEELSSCQVKFESVTVADDLYYGRGTDFDEVEFFTIAPSESPRLRVDQPRLQCAYKQPPRLIQLERPLHDKGFASVGVCWIWPRQIRDFFDESLFENAYESSLKSHFIFRPAPTLSFLKRIPEAKPFACLSCKRVVDHGFPPFFVCTTEHPAGEDWFVDDIGLGPHGGLHPVVVCRELAEALRDRLCRPLTFCPIYGPTDPRTQFLKELMQFSCVH